MKNLRAIAVRTLLAVLNDKTFLSHALETNTAQLSQQDQAWVQAACYGVLRHDFRLEALLQSYLDKPLKAKDRDINLLIRLGLYQLSAMRVPPHAAVAETVAAAKVLNKSWATGLVNAVLRGFLRAPKPFLDLNQVGFEHPAWLRKKVMEAYPNLWQDVVIQNLAQPPMHLRVNALKTTREEYLLLLREAGIDAIRSHLSESGITLDQPVDVNKLPHFAEGWVSVQDLAAQMAAFLLDAKQGEHVLDACAAPGGKMAHILEHTDGIHLLAVEVEPIRLKQIQETLSRLQLSADLKCADATHLESWWDGQCFDRILLDAPCSALGVIRRHPEIRLLRTEAELEIAKETQRNLLNTLWGVLKPGGVLLYATCSILPEENDGQIAAFLAIHQDAKVEEIGLDVGLKTEFGWQFLPTVNGPDGFYYCKLIKN